jgi:ketosteroid isomerase-like protein
MKKVSHRFLEDLPPNDDEKTVAALDTEYQAAVLARDIATMDRILADDFVLVAGKGRIYTKGDLLNEARTTDRIYEHQEVRLWGDTAVVTALLWAKARTKANHSTTSSGLVTRTFATHLVGVE